MKHILITGANGFVGTYLTQTLKQRHHCVGFSRNEGNDILDDKTLPRLNDIDVIIHTAATMSNEYEVSFQVNVLGTLNMCKYAKAQGIGHFILISSLSVYDTPDNEYYNNYSRTKKEAEEVAKAYCKENSIDLTILRLAQVYDDKRMAEVNQKMLYYFIDTIRTTGEISLFGRTNPLRNYIHIDYLCAVIEEVAVEQKIGMWNILEEHDHTITEIAYMIFDLLQKKPKIIRLTDKANIPSVHIPYANRYKSDNIVPIPLIEGIERIIQYDK